MKTCHFACTQAGIRARHSDKQAAVPLLKPHVRKPFLSSNLAQSESAGKKNSYTNVASLSQHNGYMRLFTRSEMEEYDLVRNLPLVYSSITWAVDCLCTMHLS